jgi:hypothetical protein
MRKTRLLFWFASSILMFANAAFAADVPEACNSYTPAVVGGPMPPSDSDAVVIRWLGNANFEFAHKGKVYLFDAYFDRTPRSHDLGFKASDVSIRPKRFSSRTRISIIFPILDRSRNRLGRRSSVHP